MELQPQKSLTGCSKFMARYPGCGRPAAAPSRLPRGDHVAGPVPLLHVCRLLACDHPKFSDQYPNHEQAHQGRDCRRCRTHSPARRRRDSCAVERHGQVGGGTIVAVNLAVTPSLVDGVEVAGTWIVEDGTAEHPRWPANRLSFRTRAARFCRGCYPVRVAGARRRPRRVRRPSRRARARFPR